MGVFKDLFAYKKSFQLAVDIFELSRRFPKEELFGLTSQIRRSSRSVCANFAEAFRRRKYPRYFISKLADCDAENEETGIWLDFCLAFKYISPAEYDQLNSQREQVGKLPGNILKDPGTYS